MDGCSIVYYVETWILLAVISRGIRNCNPSNIRKGQPWQGLSIDQLDPSFCTFVAPEYGIRAAFVILHNYAKEGFNTVAAIIARWAPAEENDTTAYIAAVAKGMGLPDNAIIAKSLSTYTALAKAIIQHENGQQPYPNDVFAKAYDLAFPNNA